MHPTSHLRRVQLVAMFQLGWKLMKPWGLESCSESFFCACRAMAGFGAWHQSTSTGSGPTQAARTLPLCHPAPPGPCRKRHLTPGWAPKGRFSASSHLPACIPPGGVGLPVSSTVAFTWAGLACHLAEQPCRVPGSQTRGRSSCVTLPRAWVSPHRTLLSRSTVASGTGQLLAPQACDPHVPCSAHDLTDPSGKQEPPSFLHRSCTILLCRGEPYQEHVCEAPWERRPAV